MQRIITVTMNPALDLSTSVAQVRPGVKLRCTPPSEDAGGGGVNVARAIRILGGDARAAVALGGPTGNRVLKLLQDEGVETVSLPAAFETRQNLSVVDSQTDAQFRFLMPGTPWAPNALSDVAETLEAEVQPGDLVVFSGSLPPGVTSSDFLGLESRITRSGAASILDTSGPTLQHATVQSAPGRACLRMDLDEAETLCGHSLATAADVAMLAQQLATAGCAEVIIIARGGAGSVLVLENGEAWTLQPPVVDVSSKTGAGDSFVGAYALGISGGQAPLQACRYGVGAATSAVTTPATALCIRADAERFAQAVKLRRL